MTNTTERCSRSLSKPLSARSLGTQREITSLPWRTTCSQALKQLFTQSPKPTVKDPSPKQRVSCKPLNSIPQSLTSSLLLTQLYTNTIFRSKPLQASINLAQSGSQAFQCIPRETTLFWEPMTRRSSGSIWTWGLLLTRISSITTRLSDKLTFLRSIHCSLLAVMMAVSTFSTVWSSMTCYRTL